jgi:excinuclease ABC subunit A
LLDVLLRLRDRGNTVVAIEHNPTLILRADHIVDLGPQAGREGGRVVYSGPPSGIVDCPESITGDFLAGRHSVRRTAASVRRTPTGWLTLPDVRQRNLQGISVDFPLGVLCVISGMNGSGKSSLLEALLFAVQQSKTDVAPAGGTASPSFSSLTGADQIDDVQFIDATPISRSPRSQPASVLGIFAEIRSLFASTAEARLKNFSPRHFSFNAAGGGRCETCAGAGTLAIDMRFLPDLAVACPDCRGARYRREVLEVRYRGLSIADVLALTAQEAFAFFRGRTRIQRRLKRMKDAGLDYLQLGQPLSTLSSGESQRLKLARFLANRTRARTLFLLEEPSAGLHPRDVARLLECWEALLAEGHSLIVLDHNLGVIGNADYIIELGPEAVSRRGKIIACGTPEQVVALPESIVGRFLAAS